MFILLFFFVCVCGILGFERKAYFPCLYFGLFPNPFPFLSFVSLSIFISGSRREDCSPWEFFLQLVHLSCIDSTLLPFPSINVVRHLFFPDKMLKFIFYFRRIFINLFNKYLLCAYFVLGTKSAEDTSWIKQKKSSYLTYIVSSGVTENKHKT